MTKIDPMNEPTRHLSPPNGATGDAARICPPLVSVIITNFNYGRFLEEAARSAYAQTYPRIEVVIVDDASTDESGVVLDRLQSVLDGVTIVRNPHNSGQTYSFYEGLRHSRGDYILFLDADDILLPEAVAAHMLVHLSSRLHPGFTSCDYVEIENSTLVTGASMPALPRLDPASSYRPASALAQTSGLENAPALRLAFDEVGDVLSRTCFLHPSIGRQKLFAPTSGNCFRREALELFLDAQAPMSLRLNTDVYIREAIYPLAGCILIDRALFAYRIHGQNGFTSAASLYGRGGVDMEKNRSSRKIANRAIAQRLLDRRTHFVRGFGERNYLRAFQSILDDVKIHTSDDLAAFCAELTSRIVSDAAIAEPMDAALRQKLLTIVQRRARPRRGLGHLARFVLTAGRLLGSKRLSRFGEALWHAA